MLVVWCFVVLECYFCFVWGFLETSLKNDDPYRTLKLHQRGAQHQVCGDEVGGGRFILTFGHRPNGKSPSIRKSLVQTFRPTLIQGTLRIEFWKRLSLLYKGTSPKKKSPICPSNKLVVLWVQSEVGSTSLLPKTNSQIVKHAQLHSIRISLLYNTINWHRTVVITKIRKTICRSALVF